uniref:Uncharacterized protein n=1 Tax=Caulobacter phage BL57 TaxID=3348355 RepID=A0AB74UNI4_9VIRU
MKALTFARAASNWAARRGEMAARMIGKSVKGSSFRCRRMCIYTPLRRLSTL